ncbi:saxitoxin and tetrodotoxin-binding protein 1-like [Cottoperca gobio]|uniref:Saxitoxin and tetrodotoxin-binding protein 1-like n=1 Tax=Cottoperca gobio TaxID=56716 RepID=A0A6J2PA17_COTGO|nr:saxitoxin and tetrodotoxin-binding protein 1-like [Cottoperca gobio]
MSVVKRVALLLLLLAAIITSEAVAPENCEGLKKLPTNDLHEISGDWVLVWSVSNKQIGWDLNMNLSSSHVEFRLLPDNNTVMFTERNLFSNNTCINYYINMSLEVQPDNHTLHTINTMEEKNGVTVPYNESGSLDFYETCPDCMMMVYKEPENRFLLNYRREGKHQDVEQMTAAHADHQRLAECLGFPLDKPFIYDGAADFCHKKSSPEVMATVKPEEVKTHKHPQAN